MDTRMVKVQNGRIGVPPKAARLVADNLRERILNGEFRPGEFLPPVEKLLAEFGVSRPTLREALNLLESGGLVRVRRGPGGGSEVTTPSNREVVQALDGLLRFERTTPEQLMEVRLVLEPAAARLAATRATGEQLEELAAVLAKQRSPKVLGDARRWMEMKLEFHNLIAEMSGNPVVRVLSESLRELELQAALEANYSLEFRQRGTEQQAEILEMLVARDPERAELAFRRHLQDSVWTTAN